MDEKNVCAVDTGTVKVKHKKIYLYEKELIKDYSANG